jgi:hypothetical protein
MTELSSPGNKPAVAATQGLTICGHSMALCLVIVLALLLLSGCAPGKKTSNLVLTPVTDTPTGIHHQGKFVWNDLLTDNVETAKDFYGQLFGWTFTQLGRYTVVQSEGRNIAGMVELKANPEKPSAARWLCTLSVDDVDAAVAIVRDEGGEINDGPLELLNRGRGAVVRDPQGAQLILLHAKDGDPEDQEPAMMSWLWHELWSNNAEASLAFYQKLAGYDYENYADETTDYLILVREDHWRAGIRFIDNSELEMRWVPVVRVPDTEAVAKQAEQLGGEVRVAPRPTESGSVALLIDPSGAPVIIQSWTAPVEEEEDAS